MARIAFRRFLPQYESMVSFSNHHAVSSERMLSEEIHVSARAKSTLGRKKCLIIDRPDGTRNAHTEAVASKEYGRHLPKVDERIINIFIVDPEEGVRRPFKAMWGEGLTLLDSFKRAGIDTGCPCPVHERGTEVCMGNCGVLVAAEWLDKLPPRTKEEIEVLTRHHQTGAASAITEHDRLSCVLKLSPDLDGMVVSLTPSLPAETP